jgi:hemerythrin-like domain-containing protein
MKITQALLGEHGVFYAQFEHLEQAVSTAVGTDLVRALAAFLQATLETHAQLEEELLFQTLDPYLGSMGPLAVMRTEHEEIERTLGQLLQPQDLNQAQALVQHLLQVAREHFAKEEQVLFPLTEQTLDVEILTRLGAQWAERRGVRVVEKSV